MKANIYEYSNGYGQVTYKDHLICGDNRGCWELEVEIPDYLNPYFNSMRDLLIDPDDGFTQLIDECLISVKSHDMPCLRWIDDSLEEHYITLKVYSSVETSTAMYL